MFARIVRFEGGDPERVDEAVAALKERMTDGAPPGVEGVKEFMMLVDREGGTGLGISVFETEDDLRRGDEALNQMTPPVDIWEERVSVEMYEVAIRQSMI